MARNGEGELGTNPARHDGCALAAGAAADHDTLVALAFAAALGVRRGAKRRVTGS